MSDDKPPYISTTPSPKSTWCFQQDPDYRVLMVGEILVLIKLTKVQDKILKEEWLQIRKLIRHILDKGGVQELEFPRSKFRPKDLGAYMDNRVNLIQAGLLHTLVQGMWINEMVYFRRGLSMVDNILETFSVEESIRAQGFEGTIAWNHELPSITKTMYFLKASRLY